MGTVPRRPHVFSIPFPDMSDRELATVQPVRSRPGILRTTSAIWRGACRPRGFPLRLCACENLRPFRASNRLGQEFSEGIRLMPSCCRRSSPAIASKISGSDSNRNSRKLVMSSPLSASAGHPCGCPGDRRCTAPRSPVVAPPESPVTRGIPEARRRFRAPEISIYHMAGRRSESQSCLAGF